MRVYLGVRVLLRAGRVRSAVGMTAAKANAGMAAEDRKFLADRYRKASFDLLRAARVLRDTTAELLAARGRVVAEAAVTDLHEARGIITQLPPVPSAGRPES
jgi:hypothetical protein